MYHHSENNVLATTVTFILVSFGFSLIDVSLEGTINKTEHDKIIVNGVCTSTIRVPCTISMTQQLYKTGDDLHGSVGVYNFAVVLE